MLWRSALYLIKVFKHQKGCKYTEKCRWGLNCSLKTPILLSFSLTAAFRWALQRVKPSSLTHWEKPLILACILQLHVFAKTEQREGWKTALLHSRALARSLCPASTAAAAGCTVQSRRTHLETPVVHLLEKHSTKTCALARNVHTSVSPQLPTGWEAQSQCVSMYL